MKMPSPSHWTTRELPTQTFACSHWVAFILLQICRKGLQNFFSEAPVNPQGKCLLEGHSLTHVLWLFLGACVWWGRTTRALGRLFPSCAELGFCVFFSRQSCNPLVLFEAEIEKYCPENFVDIKVGSWETCGPAVEQPPHN